MQLRQVMRNTWGGQWQGEEGTRFNFGLSPTVPHQPNLMNIYIFEKRISARHIFLVFLVWVQRLEAIGFRSPGGETAESSYVRGRVFINLVRTFYRSSNRWNSSDLFMIKVRSFSYIGYPNTGTLPSFQSSEAADLKNTDIDFNFLPLYPLWH